MNKYLCAPGLQQPETVKPPAADLWVSSPYWGVWSTNTYFTDPLAWPGQGSNVYSTGQIGTTDGGFYWYTGEPGYEIRVSYSVDITSSPPNDGETYSTAVAIEITDALGNVIGTFADDSSGVGTTSISGVYSCFPTTPDCRPGSIRVGAAGFCETGSFVPGKAEDDTGVRIDVSIELIGAHTGGH